MLVKFTGGRIYDPARELDGVVGDIFVEDGRIVETPARGAKIGKTYDLRGKIVMAGAIDLHSHIGGGKVNIARTLMPEDHRETFDMRTGLKRGGGGRYTPSTFSTGYRYAEMGYTAVFEPAIVPANARQAHMEMADVPIVDKGGYVMLGNDDFLLRMLARGGEQQAVNDYVAWMLHATQAIGIKVVNAGGISAFKFNGRRLDLDQEGPYYNLTPRRILSALTRALHDLGVAHPLHVHGSNLGVPGNVETTLDTIAGSDGLPMHLTHVQFHSYGTEGDRKFSSGAARIAEAVNANPNITVDVGQIMFGQTVTASGDTMMQYRNRRHADPNKWVCMDIECDGGCGLVPFEYRDKNFVNALQWAIGLEIILLVDDPWRVFLTTDHPNGAPFTSYPHFIRLVMDRSFRNDMLATINKHAAKQSILSTIDREYSLYEIAILTRAGPARVLGLADKGSLAPGASADIVVYTEDADREKMFATPDYVFKDGEMVVRDGAVVATGRGRTHVARPDFDRSIERSLKDYFERYGTVRMGNFRIDDDEIDGGNITVQPGRERIA